MHAGIFAVLCTTCLISAAPACAAASEAETRFDIEQRLAAVNLKGANGRDYDRRLGEYFQHRPEVEKELTSCLIEHPRPPKLAGYFRFAGAGSSAPGYELILRPSGAFADCIAAAFSGHAPPAPPQLPYFNPFELTLGE